MERNILYRDIAEDIKKKIFANKYEVGSLLPTENELEEIYDVSKITVRNAIKVLANEGYVEKKSGRGTTILSNRLFNKLSTAESFSSVLENKGLELTKHVLSIEKIAPENAPVDFEISKMTGTVAQVKKMYMLDDKPYILFFHYLPFMLDESDKERFEQSSLYQVLKEKGETADRFNDSFEGYQLREWEQKLLQTTEKIGIKRIRRSLNNRNQLVEYSEGVYLTGINPYEIRYEV